MIDYTFFAEFGPASSLCLPVLRGCCGGRVEFIAFVGLGCLLSRSLWVEGCNNQEAT